MSRSSWKPLYLSNEIATQIKEKSVNKLDELFAYNRATVLTQQMLGSKINIYNGIRFYTLVVSSDMLGHRLGEFSPTRKKPIPKKSKK